MQCTFAPFLSLCASLFKCRYNAQLMELRFLQFSRSKRRERWRRMKGGGLLFGSDMDRSPASPIPSPSSFPEISFAGGMEVGSGGISFLHAAGRDFSPPANPHFTSRTLLLHVAVCTTCKARRGALPSSPPASVSLGAPVPGLAAGDGGGGGEGGLRRREHQRKKKVEEERNRRSQNSWGGGGRERR